MNTELKEITHLDFDFKKTQIIKQPEVKPKKSFKKLITVCLLGLLVGGGYYGYNKIDSALNPAPHTYQHKWLFPEKRSISPDELTKIDNIYSGSFKEGNRSLVVGSISLLPSYYFNNLSDIKKAYEILELNKSHQFDYDLEKRAISDGENYFRYLLEDKIASDLLNGKSPKELSIAKFIDPVLLEKYQSIYEEIKPQFIQADNGGEIRYKLNKEYTLPEINNTTFTVKNSTSIKFLTLYLMRDTKAFLPNANINLKLWD